MKSRGIEGPPDTSGDMLAAIFESAEDAIVGKILDGIVTSWNAAAERIFGYSAAEMIGRPVARLATPETAKEMPHILERIRRGEGIAHYETRRRHQDGRIIDVALTVSPIRNAVGRIVDASKIARDIQSSSACGESQLGTCTPFVTWLTGTLASGQRGKSGRKIRRLTVPCSRLTPKLSIDPRIARKAILNGSFSSAGWTRPNASSSDRSMPASFRKSSR